MRRFSLILMIALSTVAVAQPWGTYEAGTTYSDNQHVGSCGRMIGMDGDGNVQMVWMKLASGSPTGMRVIYYQIWDPTLEAMMFTNGGQATGVQVNASYRAGFATMAVQPDGYCFPVYHDLTVPTSYTHVSAAMDFMPRLGAFTGSFPATLYEQGLPVEMGWPKVARGMDSILHVVSAEITTEARAARLFYSRGLPAYDETGGGLQVDWQNIGDVQYAAFDSSRVEGHDIACAPNSPRVARAWIRPATAASDTAFSYDADVFYQTSDDGGLNWGQSVNLTNFVPADTGCYRATHNGICCDRDTLRSFNDLSVLFDDAGNLHIAFTTIGYYRWLDGAQGPFVKRNKAIIWHWSDANEQFSVVAESWIDDSLLSENQNLPPNVSMVGRPSLSRNGANGRLFCSYMWYDTSAYSVAGFLNADVFVSVSVNNGLLWSVGTNVTDTRPATIPAPAGQNLNEQDATLADHLTAGTLNLFYTLDRDADMTFNSANAMFYRRVPGDPIDITPTMPDRALHVEETVCNTIFDSSADPVAAARDFRLYPAYPNPFNSTTVLKYDLPKTAMVELVVYDVLGREAAVLVRGMTEAGNHTVVWNAEGFASGIYFVSLRAGNSVRTQKIMLLK